MITFIIIAVVCFAIFGIISKIKSESQPGNTQKVQKEPVVSEEKTTMIPEPTKAPEAPKTIKPATKKAPRKPDPNGKRHKVAGTSFRQEAIISICRENPEYKKSDDELLSKHRIGYSAYRYKYPKITVTLEPEPENPHDKKAVKVLFNNVHIGYIKAGSCGHINKLLQEDRIASITGNLYGGPERTVTADVEDIDDKGNDIYGEKYIETVNDAEIWADIHIVEKEV